jgi:hypothetical protein
MSFDFRKYVPIKWKHKLPDETVFRPEVHDLHYRQELKDKVLKGELPASVLDEHFEKFKDSEQNREERFRRQVILKEMREKNIKDFQALKENPKGFLNKMKKLGQFISHWWYIRPNKNVGSGRLVQQIDGSWVQEYKPTSTKNIKDWLKASDEGKVFLKTSKKFKPEFLKKYKRPTTEMEFISEEAKKQRQNIIWTKLLQMTNNFGRTFEDKRRGRPGYGINQVRPTVNSPNPSKLYNGPRGGDKENF